MMEASAGPNVVGSIAALFALAALVVGICSRRMVSALKWGAIIGALCAALFLVPLLAYGQPGQIDWPYALGKLAGYGGFSVLFGWIGYGIRKLFSAIFRLFRKDETKAPPP